MELLKASQVAELLGHGWSRQRIHMELQRGTLGVKPFTMVGKQPLFTPEQVEEIRAYKVIKYQERQDEIQAYRIKRDNADQ